LPCVDDDEGRWSRLVSCVDGDGGRWWMGAGDPEVHLSACVP